MANNEDDASRLPPPEASAVGGGDEDFLHRSLPPGSVIGGFRITSLVGEGGFGIVYRAFDPTLHREVALKEYMPSQLASRAPGSTNVSVISPRHSDTFNAGLRSFMNEARMLAHFDHPSLVKVHQFWQANRTAYMVMPFYEGPTLKAHVTALAQQGLRPDEATLRRWLDPLLDALELMHGEQCYHRDIAPDNILLTARGPLLLDFGAARRVISDMTHALTVILKPGYAPIEQYGDAATMSQGPWTDLYALASVMYYCITGHSPITSVERVMGDPLPRVSHTAAGRYSTNFLMAVDAALAVKPQERPQSVAEFRALLGSAPAMGAAGAVPPPAGVATPVASGPSLPEGRPRPLPPLPMPPIPQAPPPARDAAPAPQPLGLAASADARVPQPAPRAFPPMVQTDAMAAARADAANGGAARRRWLLAGLVAAGALAVGVPMFWRRNAAREPVEEFLPPPPPLQPAAAATPAAAPVAPTGTDVAGPSAPAQARMPTPSPAPAPAPSPMTTSAQTPSGPRTSPRSATSTQPSATAHPPAATAAPAPTEAAPAAPRTPAPAPTSAPPPAAPASPPRPAQCSELLQKGTQQPLTLEEATFLRKECR